MKPLLYLLLVFLAGCSSHYRVMNGPKCYIVSLGNSPDKFVLRAFEYSSGITMTSLGSSKDDEILKKFPELACIFIDVNP